MQNDQEIKFIGRKKLGVVTIGTARPYAAIVLRSDNAAKVLLHEPLEDILKLVQKIADFAVAYHVGISDWDISIDVAGEGQELAEEFSRLAHTRHGCSDSFGERWEFPFERGDFADTRSQCHFDLKQWLKTGKLIGEGDFDDLGYIGYTEEGGRKAATSRSVLAKQEIDASIPDALALTFIHKDSPPPPYMQPRYEPISEYEGGGDQRNRYDCLPFG